ncbi:hypothetical protein V2J09_021350 [Rumex salicifolius]
MAFGFILHDHLTNTILMDSKICSCPSAIMTEVVAMRAGIVAARHLGARKAQMRRGSSRETLDRPNKEDEDPKIEPFVARKEHDPRELKSWAKRTGFVSVFSGESTTGSSIARNLRPPPNAAANVTDERLQGDSVSLNIEPDPVLGRTSGNRALEIEPGFVAHNNGNANQRRRFGNGSLPEDKDDNSGVRLNVNTGERLNKEGNGVGVGRDAQRDSEQKLEESDWVDEVGINVFPDGEEPILPPISGENEVKYGVTDKPGFALLCYYSIQHYLSIAGSLVFVPLLMVPAMGGTDKDTAYVISTMLFVSGITTLLHSFFGTRLPLVQGSSFVYLAPALVIMNSQDFRNLTEHKFRYIMRELQGAIIIGSIFQSLLGFSGLFSHVLRFINPVVVAPTVASVGLAFLSYGFPQAGSCVEISVPQILLLLIFTLYLRGVSISGHRIFRIYAVPLSVAIIWAYAFFLTASGAYNYKGCSPDIPSSNVLIDACKRHAYTMKHCRTDVSDAWRTALWVRVPYPLQWGIPIFHMRTSIIIILVALVSSVDSVATYHSTALQINSKPPTPGIVSRGIGMEGFCSILGGLWGTGTASTTLMENIHTINGTKVANRRAVQIGAIFIIFVSFFGKVGAILASIPQALAAAVLCFMWALTVGLGLSNLKHSQASSFRNMAIVGVSLFLGLSIPAYFQQYHPESSLILPGYLIPYSAASSGPINTSSQELDFAINGLLSLSMVVTFIIALVLDNTVPGSKEDRGAYGWSSKEDLEDNPESLANYSLPKKIAGVCCWAKCLGVYEFCD